MRRPEMRVPWYTAVCLLPEKAARCKIEDRQAEKDEHNGKGDILYDDL